MNRRLVLSQRWRRNLATAALAVLGVAAVGSVALVPAHRAGAAEDRCEVPGELLQLGGSLRNVTARLREGRPLTIVALGSSSTFGTGASSAEHSYPARLAVELRARFPNVPIRVLNRGVGGEISLDMAQRMERDVFPAKPDLVIWQVGTNSVLRELDAGADGGVIARGVERLKAFGTDVLLMNMQYAPAVLAHPRYREMLHVIAAVARRENVAMFRRFAMMRYWAEEERWPVNKMLAPDHLHMNDASYGCLARLVADSIAATIHAPTVAASL